MQRNLFILAMLSDDMEIKEILMHQSFSINTPDPYMFSLKLMEELSKDVKLVEKKNEYETDGPHHRSIVVFEAVDTIDNFSKVLFKFDLVGDDGLLRADVSGLLKMHVDENGFFGQVFSDYYVRTTFPILRKISGEKIDFFSKKIDDLFAG